MKEFHIVNMKKLRDKKYTFPDTGAVAILGGNDTGKSTIIQCIQNILIAKNFIPNAVSIDSTEDGVIDYTGIDVNGSPIIVHMNIHKDDSSDIVCMYFDQETKKNKKISDPGVIRALLGDYFPLGVHQVFSMLKYAEGRRDFFQKYITRIISPQELKRITEIDLNISEKENKTTMNNLFFRRRELSKRLSDEAARLETYDKLEKPQYTRESLEKVKDEIKAKIKELENLKDLHSNLRGAINQFHDIWDELENGKGFITTIYTDNELGDPGFGSAMQWCEDQIERLSKLLPDLSETTDKIQELQTKNEKAVVLLTMWDAYDKTLLQKENVGKEIQILQSLVTELTDQINKLREERITIISRSNLPEGMSIDDEYNIYVNGILFHDASISETTARMYIIKLLLKISGGSFIDIGDWSLYDKENKSLIVQLAKENNCLLMGQYVNNDEEVTIKVIE